MLQPIVDTHVHAWKRSADNYQWLQAAPPLLQQDYMLDALEQERVNSGIAAGVMVQADNSLADTEWMLQCARRHAWIKGVVAWLPLTDPALTQRLLEAHVVTEPLIKGIRHLIHDEPDPKWLLQPTVIESLQLLAQFGLVYDVVAVLPEHIETALTVADKVPHLRMVFDHLSQPPINSGSTAGQWSRLMGEAARHTNFYAKISGLGTAAKNGDRWTAGDIEPFVAFCLEKFGTDRCLCGGDWPVSLLAGSYTNTWAAYRLVLEKLLTHEDREKVYSSNAAKLYSLAV